VPSNDSYSTLHSLLGSLPDPRDPRGRRHHLADVLFITLVAVIAGSEDAEAIQDFGEYHAEWFGQRCRLRHGIPTQDTYLRVLALLVPERFGVVFSTWVAELWGADDDRHIALDGKTLRRSFDRAAGQSPVHSVAAFASASGLVLGQVAIRDKENEIVAIPRLLELVDVSGATVTIDAMGCQTAIAQAIVDRGGDYVLQVKGNHPTLQGHIASFFDDAQQETRPLNDPKPELLEAVDVDLAHGRIETRRCLVSYDLSWIEQSDRWPGLAGIARIERLRESKQTGESSQEVAHYILSGTGQTAERVNALARSHWSIENTLHWVLDVTFDEDQCRVRKGNAAENFGLIRRTALNMLRVAPNPGRHRNKKKPISMKRRRRWVAMSEAYREEVLRIAS
jgi:predicted transposase YbfD/YdcC